ncbi:MAG: tetratricopeptide repeat protein [Parvularculaceae bacterium]|nr:tetratricopeptide repeat protein [Parvularculaceae bacterium]
MMKLRNAIAGAFAAGLMIGAGAIVLAQPEVSEAGNAEASRRGDQNAQEGEGENQPRRRSETLDPAVAKVLGEVFELQNLKPPQLQPSLQKLNDLIAARPNMKPYDKSTTYQMRGSIKVQLDDYQGALRDFQASLDAGGLPPNQNNQLRYFIAQIQFQLENYQAAIQGLNAWIASARAEGTPVDANAYYLLAAAYTQVTPPNWRAASGPAEQAIAARTEPKKSDHDLLNLIYSELGENSKRGPLLEKMINLWPNERAYWVQLSGFYSQTQKDKDAFAVLEVAYRAGLLTRESELITLVNYYSYFDNPFRGAKLMEREMEAGRIAKNIKNLTLLSQLWSQSREHKRAIPVLRQAAQSSGDGELYYRLGQVLLADEQYADADRALTQAINKGGMNAQKTGDAWLLIGTARFSAGKPEDCNQRSRARQAFVNAQRYPNSSRQASDWVTYIDAITRTLGDQDKLEQQQNEDARLDQMARLKQAIQVCRLRGGADCTGQEAQLKALIEAGPVKLKSSCAGAPADGEPAAATAPPQPEGGAQ